MYVYTKPETKETYSTIMSLYYIYAHDYVCIYMYIYHNRSLRLCLPSQGLWMSFNAKNGRYQGVVHNVGERLSLVEIQNVFTIWHLNKTS